MYADYSMTPFRKKLNIFRHGDLLIREVSTIPSNAIPLSTNIIAMGEKTGHNHQISGPAQVYETPDKQKYFQANKEIFLKHQEHNSLRIQAGRYVIISEREYDPFEDIQVWVED